MLSTNRFTSPVFAICAVSVPARPTTTFPNARARGVTAISADGTRPVPLSATVFNVAAGSSEASERQPVSVPASVGAYATEMAAEAPFTSANPVNDTHEPAATSPAAVGANVTFTVALPPTGTSRVAGDTEKPAVVPGQSWCVAASMEEDV